MLILRTPSGAPATLASRLRGRPSLSAAPPRTWHRRVPVQRLRHPGGLARMTDSGSHCATDACKTSIWIKCAINGPLGNGARRTSTDRRMQGIGGDCRGLQGMQGIAGDSGDCRGLQWIAGDCRGCRGLQFDAPHCRLYPMVAGQRNHTVLQGGVEQPRGRWHGLRYVLPRQAPCGLPAPSSPVPCPPRHVRHVRLHQNLSATAPAWRALQAPLEWPRPPPWL